MFLQVYVCPQGGYPRMHCRSHDQAVYKQVHSWCEGSIQVTSNAWWDRSHGTPPQWRTPPWMESPPRWRMPPGWRTPPDGEPPLGQCAGGTHPTGMHSCLYLNPVSNQCRIYIMRFKLCSYRASALLSDQSSTHLIFDASPDTDTGSWCEWYNWNQFIPSKHQQQYQSQSQRWYLVWIYSYSIHWHWSFP